jgi:hypothetical protein
MGKIQGNFRRELKLASIIHSLPNPGDKPYQQCTKEEKARMALEVGFKEMTGTTYTEQWYMENSKYL